MERCDSAVEWVEQMTNAAYRVRDRENRALWRLYLGFGLASALITLFGLLANRNQKKELVLALRFPTVRSIVVYGTTGIPQRLELRRRIHGQRVLALRLDRAAAGNAPGHSAHYLRCLGRDLADLGRCSETRQTALQPDASASTGS